MTAGLNNCIMCWLLFLGLKEGLVKCATVSVKSEVILVSVIDRRKVLKSEGARS